MECSFKIVIISMKGMSCRNVERLVANHNRQVARAQEGSARSQLDLECILGVSGQEVRGSAVFALNNEEVIYYCSQYFVVHNLLTKQNSMIRKEGSLGQTTLFVDRFCTDAGKDIIFTVERSPSHLYVLFGSNQLGQLEITGNITETNGTQSQPQIKNFNWKLSKLSNKHHYHVQHLSYHSEKAYLYLLVSQNKQDRAEKALWVYDLRRECLLLSTDIKTSVAKVDIGAVWVTEDPTEVYLWGRNYFRFWTISFNQKTLKESNYRNIQRCLAGKKVLRLFNTHSPGGKMLAVLTEIDLVLLRRNELASCQKPPTNSIKKAKSKANIEVELENSLNQIYRMKFMFDQEEADTKPAEEFQFTPEGADQESSRFACASELWNSEGTQCLVVATRAGNLLTYAIAGGQLRLLSQLMVRRPHSFDAITASRKGEVILLSEKRYQQLYIINKYSLSSQETEQELKPFWGAGHLPHEDIVGLGSPAIHQRVCTLGEHGTMRLWSFKGLQRRILFEEKMMNQPTQLAMHPCGMLVAINYAKEIKLMSLLPTGLYEVMTAKTNYNSVGVRYSECGNYLVSNEENLLMFYNPFNLKALGYLQPPELKSFILDFQITPQGRFICYQTSDFALYVMPLDLQNYSKYANLAPSHLQKEAYTCFHFQIGIIRTPKGSDEAREEDLFLGCSPHKYMALYQNAGKTLVSEFPVEDCYITSLCVAQGWLFAATSKQSIRVYRWPIFEEDCEMEVLSSQQRSIRFKPPRFEEYFFWGDDKKILKIHKLGFSARLIVAREGGVMNVLTFSRKGGLTEEGERKKLMQVVNDSFFITKNESEKRNRLIEKTEGDILKVENEIAKQKGIMERKYKEECQQIDKTHQEKAHIHNQDKNDYLAKIRAEIVHLKKDIANKRAQYQAKQTALLSTYDAKKHYEQQRNDHIHQKAEQTVAAHKQRVAALIDTHRETIRGLKNSYRDKIVAMRKQFESMVAIEYPHLASKQNITKGKSDARSHRDTHQSRTSIRVRESCEITTDPLRDHEISALSQKVEEVKINNEELGKILEEVKGRVQAAEGQDQILQKDFQRCLEEYNSNRFSNLSLHSEVLKMRTQLVERKEIMDNKQDIINLAFQQRQKLENYKELVRGSLTKLQDRKEQTYHFFLAKENQLALIFQELTHNIQDLQSIKREERRVEALAEVVDRERRDNSSRMDELTARLKELKRYLLLQGLTEDAEQKKMYVQQENLLTSINFYKKRMSMEFLKEKKNKVLKKSALNLVLKQNKNLLQECNQLREETIQYDHEINNLGRKLGEANKMIVIETKLKDQKSQVQEQRHQLEAIRALFNDQMTAYDEGPLDIL